MRTIQSKWWPAVLLAFAWLASGCSQNEYINQTCSAKYKDSVIGRWNCISNENRRAEDQAKEEQKARLSEAREIAARDCIAGDLSRMEQLAARAVDSVEETSTLEALKPAFVESLGAAEIQPAGDDIKERVLVARIDTNCNSDFYLLINIGRS